MVLSMSRPWPHPKTGVFYFRKAVPEKLRPLLKKREEKVSLHTRDPVEAKRLHSRKSVEIDNRWARLGAALMPIDGAKAKPISRKTLMALVGEFYRRHIAANDENPDPLLAQKWRTEIKKYETIIERPVGGFQPTAMEIEYGKEAKVFLASNGYVLDQSHYRMFLYEFAKALTDANRQLIRNAAGDYTPDPKGTRFPRLDDKKVHLWGAWEKYSARLKPASRKRWRPIMTRLEARFGDDLTKLTFDGLLKLRDDRLEVAKPKTVREGDIAAIRWLLERLVKDRKLQRNVAAGIEVRDDKNVPTKQKGFQHDQARKILAATLVPPGKLMTPENAAARRWVPWLCAYTGARTQ